jgi:ribose-phosphate pyrophosphokinase
MSLRLVAGSAHPQLAGAIGRDLRAAPVEVVLDCFPDGERHVVVGEPLRDADVFVVQPTCAPVGEHLFELSMLVDACTRSGAARITAVVPYFGYARQDRRTAPGEAVAAKIAARAIEAAGVHRVLLVDPHSRALETMFDVAVEILSAVHVMVEALRPVVGRDAVVVAPDLGAVKLAERYAAVLDLPVAIVRKTRVTGELVRAVDVVGDVHGRRPVIVDDMITTAGTVEAAAHALLERGCQPDLVVAATHGLLVGPAVARLHALPVRHVVVSDSVPVDMNGGLPLSVCSLHEMLATAIAALHTGAQPRRAGRDRPDQRDD